MLIDAYEITFDPLTMKVESSKVRNASIHWDVTTVVLYDPPPGDPPDWCTGCSFLNVQPTNDGKYSIQMTLTLTNLSGFDGYDVRAILIENSTNPEKSFQMLFPDDYTDVWAGIHGDDDGGTNPFGAYRKSIPERAFYPDIEEPQSKIIMVTNAGTEEVRALLIIDASWPDNCAEPYSIEFVMNPDDQYISLPQGIYEANFWIRAFDHQNDYSQYVAGALFPPGIACPFTPYGDGSFWGHITVNPSLPGGTYEGIIIVVDNSVPGPVNCLKEKIWVTVNPLPLVESFPSGQFQARFISSPVRVNLDGDPFLETVYTADNRVYVIDEIGQNPPLVLGGGCFIGVPTFSRQDVGVAKDIIFTNDPMGGGASMLWVYRFRQGLGFQFIWSYELPSAPAGQPLPVRFATDIYDRILVLCRGGQRVLLRGGPGIPPPDRPVYIIDSSDTYLGAPASYGQDPFNPFAADIARSEAGTCKLEIFRVQNAEIYAQAEIPPIPDSARPTPVIDVRDYGSGAHRQIFVSCFDGVGRIQDEGDGILSIGWMEEIYGHHNEYSQIALGDMNHDFVPDVVVAFDELMIALDGKDGDTIWSYSIPDKDYYFHSPSLIDFNNDNYLDVVTGIFPLSENMSELVVIDGSPYNNHNRLNPSDRILWSWDPGGSLKVMYQQPCLTKTSDGRIKVGMTFMEVGFGVYGAYSYSSISTNYNFGFNWEDYQRKPWLTAFYNHRAENNITCEFPEYGEG